MKLEGNKSFILLTVLNEGLLISKEMGQTMLDTDFMKF